jgi:hypothetical protein
MISTAFNSEATFYWHDEEGLLITEYHTIKNASGVYSFKSFFSKFLVMDFFFHLSF